MALLNLEIYSSFPNTDSLVRLFVHQGRQLATGSLSTCLQPSVSAEA